MQLVYLWSKSPDMNLKGEGIHFHSELRFEYLPDLGELLVKENPFYLENFFSENSNFDQLTAVVGRNGTGKTTLLRFMISLLSNGNEGFASKILEEPILCVIRTSFRSDEFIVVHNPELKLTGGNYKQHNIHVIQPDYFSNPILLKDNEALFNNISLVLYSNIFDYSANKSGINLIDLSTNTLLSLATTIDPNAHETQLLKYEDTGRQINFFLEQRNSPHWKIPFEVPQFMYFRFSRLLEKLEDRFRFDIIQYGTMPTNFTNNEASAFENYLLNIFEVLESSSPFLTDTPNDKGVRNLTKLFFYLLYESFRNSPKECVDEINEFIEEKILQLDYYVESNMFSIFVGYIKEGIEEKRGVNIRFLQQITTLEDIFDSLLNLISSKLVILEEKAIRAPLFLSKSPAATVLSILWQRDREVNVQFDMDWPDLSSGEKSLLTMYARLYETFSLDIEQEHILLMIDEGELYMHPQWQRKFIKELIDFCTEYCCVKKKKKLDVILTTNSPFLISDLPHANIIFLETTEKGATVVGGLEEHRQTFAANIHTLLSDAFFLPDGLLGEFAKQKLNRLIQELYQESISDILKKEGRIRKQIEIIGEPVIRNKLLSVLEDRLRIQDHSAQRLVRRISDLEAEVRALKGKIDDQNY
ncbi:AAA family ATPase [Paenibacillus xylanexedens]|uniref:AAA family ATPase n=1 Tax=Paenibacillus xylanexedens TaxID=528191 RepID=UPI001F031C9F|nr:AAA family ATPase [Paenibacillus xylanexedens]MCF7753168.1 AAA family ATPase [Paenibacillus xylanexedens]